MVPDIKLSDALKLVKLQPAGTSNSAARQTRLCHPTHTDRTVLVLFGCDVCEYYGEESHVCGDFSREKFDS
jgi:hypothetical protein